MSERNGTQVGDPPKAAKAMWEVAKMDNPPLRVVLGSDAYDMVQTKLKEYGELYPKYEKLSKSTDVEEKK